MQLILRAALDADPAPCFGLLGATQAQTIARTIPQTITHTAPLAGSGTAEFAKAVAGNRDLQHRLEKWSAEGVTLCGIYFTTDQGEIPALPILLNMEKTLRQGLPALAGRPLILMPLMLNTAGCLEAFAYKSGEDALIAIPLILAEDGDRMDSGQRTVSL